MKNPHGEIIIYQSADGLTHIDVKMQDETVWLTQAQLVELCRSSKANVSEHIKRIFEEGELDADQVVRKFRTTAADGKKYNTAYYNLDMIISLGYRIKSSIATSFRRWATERIREYIIKGFTIDDELLKGNGDGNYFAAHGHTAAEVIYERADADKPFMGLMSFPGELPALKDVGIAKNYLDESELKILNSPA